MPKFPENDCNLIVTVTDPSLLPENDCSTIPVVPTALGPDHTCIDCVCISNEPGNALSRGVDGCLFASGGGSGNGASMLVTSADVFSQPFGEERFIGLTGFTLDPIETNQMTPMFSGSFEKLGLYVLSNTLDEDTIVVVRRNGVDTALSITVPAGGLGYFPLTIPVAYGGGDFANYRLFTGPSTVGSIEVTKIVGVYLVP